MGKGRPPRFAPRRNSPPRANAAALIKARLQQAIAAHQLGQFAQAAAGYQEILRLQPRHCDALHLLGVVAVQRNETQKGVALIRRALAIDPNSAAAHSNLGNALMDLKRLGEALASYERALALKPDYAEALYNRGNALLELQRPEDALASYERALALKPDYVEALYNRGNALRDLQRPEEALASYERALALKADYAEALNNRGNALRDLQRPEDALASYERALAFKPEYPDALTNRGNALLELRRPEDALASHERALALKPDYADAYSNRGNALLELKRAEDALASYEHALALKPDRVEILNNRGYALLELKRPEQAAQAFRRLIEAAPEYQYAMGMLFHAEQHGCDWTHYAHTAAQIVTAVNQGRHASTPFPFLAVSQSGAAQLQCARTFIADKYPASPAPLWKGERYRHDRIRVAYLSADFREHAVSYLIAELLKVHDRSRFEIIGVSFNSADMSATGRRVKAAFDRFIDVSRQSDFEAARLIRGLEVDIAVDLMGHTKDVRTGILAHRPCPLQVNYLGYPGTMGADYIDYIIADRIVIPEEEQCFYAEKAVWLPDTFQVNDASRIIADSPVARRALGLPEDARVFCCFNNSYKIAPAVFSVWMNLLKQAPDSVLWLVGDSASIVTNLRNHASEQGVDPARLVFAARADYAEYLARYRLADLFLDTLPFNGGTTASDALWAGLPVLTCAGTTFAARMAGSLLRAIGLPELVTHDLREYEALALQLAAAPAMLSDIKAKLATNRLTHPLFDTDRFRRHIESAYITMHGRYQRGEAAESFSVPPLQCRP